MDLFESSLPRHRPLAEEARPEKLEDLVGQEHLIGPGKILSTLIAKDRVPSLIFWGPPGVGKTTLARLIARTTKHNFVSLSAVSSGVKDVKEVVANATAQLKLHDRRTLLFLDEIHRFNKAQQDAFLPHVEAGTITLIGATTENPSFEVNSALLSRCQVFVLKPLTAAGLKNILTRALALKKADGLLTDEAADMVIESSQGDARYLLNVVEDLLSAFPDQQNVSAEEVREKIIKQAAFYDKNAEHHYNVISAFIKSLRGSDPDAALYYLARMLDAGEQGLYIARRMVIFASEDIGNANPQALQVAIACQQAFDFLGDAEGWIPLAQGVTYLACSPKSNASYAGYNQALSDVQKYGALEVPLHLRNAPTKLMKNLGYHEGYKYAHSFEGNKVEQQHLPDAVKTQRYYYPTENGFEKNLKEWLERRATGKKKDES